MSTTSSAVSRSYWPAKGLAAVFDYAAASNRRAAVALLLVCLVGFLPGFFQIPPVDRDEAYFAQATKQMIETGDYVDIRYQDDVRYRKPVGIYWLQASVVNAASALGFANARTTIWLYRVPSLIGAIGAVLATYWCALAFVGRRGAVLAALMMMSSPILGVEARLAKTDAFLLFTTVVAMAVLARAYLAPRRGDPPPGLGALAMFWTALAVGILIKGPLILMVVGLAAASLSILDRSARWLLELRPLPRKACSTFGFLFLANRAPGPIRHDRQAFDRPRASLCWRPRGPFCLQPLHLASRICQHAVGPRDNVGRRGYSDRCDLAAHTNYYVAMRQRSCSAALWCWPITSATLSRERWSQRSGCI